jgi:hypothetical protein
MPNPTRLTKREARKWVRQHWAEFMRSADNPDGIPDEAAEVWSEECFRLAERIDPS